MLGELNGTQIEQILHSEVVGRIGCHDAGRSYVGTDHLRPPRWSRLRAQHRRPEAAHDAREPLRVLRGGKGRRSRELAQRDRVGRVRELAGKDEQHALQLLVDRLMPLLPSATAHPEIGVHDSERPTHDTPDRTPVLYRIVSSEKIGQFEKQ